MGVVKLLLEMSFLCVGSVTREGICGNPRRGSGPGSHVFLRVCSCGPSYGMIWGSLLKGEFRCPFPGFLNQIHWGQA